MPIFWNGKDGIGQRKRKRDFVHIARRRLCLGVSAVKNIYGTIVIDL